MIDVFDFSMNGSLMTLVFAVCLGAALASPGGRSRGGEGRGRGGRPPMGHHLLCSVEGDLELPEYLRPSGQCPDESECTIGPITVQKDGQSATLTFCDAEDEDGNLQVVSATQRDNLKSVALLPGTAGLDNIPVYNCAFMVI